MTTILKALMGSHTHGLNDEHSDRDYRSIFIHPTDYVLSIGPNKQPGLTKNTSVQPEGDDVSFEVAHYCNSAAKGNPAMLEILRAPTESTSLYGTELQSMLRAFLSRDAIFNAYHGYAYGQKKEVYSARTLDRRVYKLMVATIRVLFNGAELLRTGDFTLKISDTSIGDDCRAARSGSISTDEFQTIYTKLYSDLQLAYDASTLPLNPDYKRINEFILKIRKENWTSQ